MAPRTRLVCVTHASNILGTINPIRADRRLRACARRADLRRRRRLCAAPGDRRAGARRRLLRLLVLQDLRAALRRDVRPARCAARARRALSLFLRQGESAGKARAGQSELRAGLGRGGHRRLRRDARRRRRAARRSSAPSQASPRRRPTSANGCSTGCARRNDMPHHRPSAVRRARCACRPSRSRSTGEAPDARSCAPSTPRKVGDPPRRFPLAPTDRGARPRAGGRRSACRWCTTTRSTRSTG